MGNWHVSIIGGGQHDNGMHDDVEHVVKRSVAELRAAGHHISHAVVTSGSAVQVQGVTDFGHVPLLPRELTTGTDDQAMVGARRAYEKYIAHSGGLNYEGKPCPTWFDLPQAIRDHWLAAVTP